MIYEMCNVLIQLSISTEEKIFRYPIFTTPCTLSHMQIAYKNTFFKKYLGIQFVHFKSHFF